MDSCEAEEPTAIPEQLEEKPFCPGTESCEQALAVVGWGPVVPFWTC